MVQPCRPFENQTGNKMSKYHHSTTGKDQFSNGNYLSFLDYRKI
jgi:hypothetical protein